MFLCDSGPILEGLRMGGVGVWRWKVDADDLQWTENLERVHDLPEGSFNGTLSSFRRDIHPDDADAVWRNIRATIESGEPYRAVYRTTPKLHGEPLWIETSGGIVTASDGTRYLTGVCLNVTARVKSELELKRRLRQQKAIERFGSFALAEPDFQKIMQTAAETAADVLDVPLAEVLQFADTADHLILKAGTGWKEGLVGKAAVGIDNESQAGFTLLNGGPVVVRDLSTETRFDGPALLRDHHVRSGISVVIPGSEERPFGVFGIHTPQLRNFDQADVDFLLSLANIVANSARHHAAAEHQSLLMREMAHRAGNMLQLVSSIANQTFSCAGDTDSARQSFSERLAALSRANNHIAQGGWTSTRFVSLLEESLQPFRERLVLQGRDILLPPELCFDLGLVLHELATNSVKYGTLGEDKGRIAVRWMLSAGAGGAESFSFAWDDPLTSKLPAEGNGFGSRLMRALVERKWGGSIKVETETGYRFSFELTLAT
ncbi:MAG: sensor histidine kinase [Hyphomicrobiales bacterium]